jgi:nucleotide-binding universal stress UspA family protein
MKRYKRILVPVDGSDLSNDAFEQALSLAKLVDGTVTVLHVIEQPYSDYSVFEGQEMLSASALIETETKEHVQNFLSEYSRKGKEADVPVKTLIKEGPVAHEIIDLSKRFDLIIIGTHGRRMIASLIMGSVAERVSRHAYCPVMLIREISDPDKE